MINTYNESKLHKTLKTLYAEEYNGQTEVELYGHIYDIVVENANANNEAIISSKTNDNDRKSSKVAKTGKINTNTVKNQKTGKTIIEIQTKNLSKLLAKIMDTLEKGHKVILVYPLVIQKWIELYDKEGKLISKRKSPKKNSIYDLFDEITGLYPILLHENFMLDVIKINMTETRLKTDMPVQSKNRRRRFRKDWIKTGKELKEIIQKRTFAKADDYLNLLPQDLPQFFCAKDLAFSLKNDKTLPASASKNAHLIIWVLNKMKLLEKIDVKNRRQYYKINY